MTDFSLLYGVIKNTLRIIIHIHGNSFYKQLKLCLCVLVCRMAAQLQALKTERKQSQKSCVGGVGCGDVIWFFCWWWFLGERFFLVLFGGFLWVLVSGFFFSIRRVFLVFLKTTGLKFSKVNLPENFVQWHMDKILNSWAYYTR